jgi:DNA-binding transcriptional LysR family regulator
MRFNKLDLNLLVALDALLTENSISRAAQQVHLSQGAMSNALARLREHFGDELLVAVGRRMEPTARAQALAPVVRDLLVRIDSTLQVQPLFDARHSDRVFRLVVSDYSIAVFVPHLLQIVEQEQATVRFEFLPQYGPTPAEALERGTADVLIVPYALASLDHPTTPLFQDVFTCLVAETHRLAGGSISLEDYQSAGHVVMQPSPLAFGMSIDTTFLNERGIARKAEVTTYAFSSLPALLIGTNRVATLQRRLARLAQSQLPVVEAPPQFETPIIDQRLQWHRLRASDPGLLWLRHAMMRAARAMPAL